MPAISTDQLLQALAGLRPQLADDPLFTEAGDLEALEGYVRRFPGTLQRFFCDTLQGDSEAYRYAALLLVAELLRRSGDGRVHTWSGALPVDDEEVFLYWGDLKVDGDLALGDQAIVLVAGDLELNGAFVGAEWDYSLLAVAGSMTASDVMTQGELIVGKHLSVRDVAYLYRSDHSAVAPSIEARVLVENERFDRFGAIEADEHIAELLSEEQPDRLRHAGSLLGSPDAATADELEAALRRRLSRNVPI